VLLVAHQRELRAASRDARKPSSIRPLIDVAPVVLV
jgi:hypothetical protein